MAMGYFELEIKDLTHLQAIVSQVEKVKGVVSVYRAEPGKRT
jgi:(p)ppGpp synthase/HD superfamily hydrolase